MIEGHERQIGQLAWVMAWVGLVVGQLHALARFRTADGLEDIDPDNYPLTAAWAVPADDLLSPLLDWGNPDLVYVTYGKIWVPVFLVVTLCAVVVYRRRRPAGFEKWMWRINIVLFAAATLGVFLTYGIQFTGSYEGDGVEAALFTIGTWFDFLGLGLMLIFSQRAGRDTAGEAVPAGAAGRAARADVPRHDRHHPGDLPGERVPADRVRVRHPRPQDRPRGGSGKHAAGEGAGLITAVRSDGVRRRARRRGPRSPDRRRGSRRRCAPSRRSRRAGAAG